MFSVLTWDTSMWDMARGGGTARLEKTNMAPMFSVLTWDTSMWDMARGGGTARLEKANMAPMFRRFSYNLALQASKPVFQNLSRLVSPMSKARAKLSWGDESFWGINTVYARTTFEMYYTL
jgi:hypothetical protein